MDKHAAPLFEALAAHAGRREASFHVPGHKSGHSLAAERDDTAAAYLRGAMAIDYTEIAGLDDLHDPTGVIRQAEELAADCFGAEETHFLVGGSTAGNLAMILAVCAPGDLLIVQRNVHKSVVHGLMLAGARAVFLPPRWDAASGIAAGVSAADVDAALADYPEAAGVLLANPNYYGMAADLREIAQIVHARGKTLLVDEAHGAHFGFHPDVPPSALAQGADAVVQSTHKMLTALTMGAMLHVRGDRINRTALRQRLTVVQSSSPSYPIMASLDLSRRLLHTAGGEALEPGLEAVRAFRRGLEELPHYRLVGHEPGWSAYDALDPFKATLRDATGTLGGYRLQQELALRGCHAEMADPQHVLLLFSLASRAEDAQRLLAALAAIGREHRLHERGIAAAAAGAPLPYAAARSLPVPMRLPLVRDRARIERVALRDAAGACAAEMIVPYPPGIPVLYPHELVTPEAVHYLQALDAAGARFQGAEGGRLQRIAVYREAGDAR